MTLDAPPSVKIDVLRISFFQDDSLVQRIRRCNRGIKDYLDKIPRREHYRIHLRTVTPKQVTYGVYYHRG